MEVILEKVSSAKNDMMVLTFRARKDAITIDPFDYIDKAMDLRVNDEKEAQS